MNRYPVGARSYTPSNVQIRRSPTEDGLDLVATRLKHWKTLHMFQCAVTDEGMRSFSRCAAQSSGVAPCEERNYRQRCTKSRRAASSLCRLYIAHCTGVTNVGAFALAEAMPDLTVFDVASTSASDNGKCQLKLLLPDCNL